MVGVQPLSPVLGARISGVDVARPLDRETFSRVEAALHAHCFIVFPRQKLAAAQFVAFGRRWGPPEPHVIDTLLDELKAHATRAEYRHTYDYTAGDVMVWDNAQLLHAAPLADAAAARTLWRVTVKEALCPSPE